MHQNIKLKDKKYILDTSALIALLERENGYEVILDKLDKSIISTVTLSEFVSVLIRKSLTEDDIDKIRKNLLPDIIVFCEEISVEAGKLISITKPYGLSLGDRACIATGSKYNLTIYTTDKIWDKLNDILDADIIVMR